MDRNFSKQAMGCLMALIENPYLKNNYERFSKLYRRQGFTNEANALDFLIEQKFNVKTTDHSISAEK
jgi:hypothetical protein